jgi:hypothetical protein
MGDGKERGRWCGKRRGSAKRSVGVCGWGFGADRLFCALGRSFCGETEAVLWAGIAT